MKLTRMVTIENWTVEEVEDANNYLNWINKNFRLSDATVIVSNVVKEYKIDLKTIDVRGLRVNP